MTVYALISSALNFLIASGLAIYFLLVKDRSPRQKGFAFFCLSIAAWSSAYFLWQASPDAERALFFSRLLIAGSMIIPVAYLWFVSKLTGVNRQALTIGGIAAVLLFMPVLFTPAGVAGVSPKGSFPFWPDAGPVLWLYFTVFFGYPLYAWWLQLRAISSLPGRDANQIKFFFIASVVGFLGGSSNFPLWYDIPIPPLGNGLVSVYLAMMGYGFFQYKRSIVRMSLIKEAIHICLILAVVIFYLLALHSASAYFGYSIAEETLLVHFFTASAVLAGSFWLIPRLKLEVERVLEATLLKQHYRHRNQLQALTHRISSMRQEEEMFAAAVEALHHFAHATKAAIFVRSDLSPGYPLRASAGYAQGMFDALRLTDAHRLVGALRQKKKALILDELDMEESLDVQGKLSWQGLGVELALPISCDNVFFGLLVLGPRAKHQAYADVDISLFEALCFQIGLTLRSRQLERRLNQTEKLVSLGTFAAGLAHEIRNPLVSLRTYAELAGNDGDDAELCRAMKRDVNRIAGIVENISNFAADRSINSRPVAIHEILSAVHEIAKSELNQANVKLVIDDDGPTVVLANFNQMVQVFLNLIQNAVQAMEGRPEKTLRITVTRWTDQATIQPLVAVSVADTGCGIDPLLASDIFEPFVTTRDTGDHAHRRGLGLGLAIVKRIIESHQGHIEVTTRPGEGSTFRILLPQNMPSPTPAPVRSRV